MKPLAEYEHFHLQKRQLFPENTTSPLQFHVDYQQSALEEECWVLCQPKFLSYVEASAPIFGETDWAISTWKVELSASVFRKDNAPLKNQTTLELKCIPEKALFLVCNKFV
ncbi:hypothetical protein TCAL_17056 [Tigriopus californicus]|uniref:Uncharacterized protein n=1 Tax=Tigriopus californicus TaxID=6832 RepID=A0A553PQ18_TIGCA|nr:hypothetical protein TCAL_17056 [Tigriopus californicus]